MRELNKEGSLKDLVIDATKEAERILYEILKNYVRFDEKTKDINFLEKFNELPKEKK